MNTARNRPQRSRFRRTPKAMSDTLLVEPSTVSPARRVIGGLLRSREMAIFSVLVGVVVVTTIKSPASSSAATAGVTSCCHRPSSCCWPWARRS